MTHSHMPLNTDKSPKIEIQENDGGRLGGVQSLKLSLNPNELTEPKIGDNIEANLVHIRNVFPADIPRYSYFKIFVSQWCFEALTYKLQSIMIPPFSLILNDEDAITTLQANPSKYQKGLEVNLTDYGIYGMRDPYQLVMAHITGRCWIV